MNIKYLKQIKAQTYAKIICLVAIMACAWSLGSHYTQPKIAVVNMTAVATQSAELNQLKRSNSERLNELSLWLDRAKQEINAEKKKAKRENLAREYKEIAQKRNAEIKADYDKGMSAIAQNINELIDKTAKKYGCRTVFNRSAVLSGGIDITQEVVSALK